MGSRGGAADPPHPAAGPRLTTVTLDGSLLGAPAGPRAVGGFQGGVHGSPRSSPRQVGRSPRSAASPPLSAGSSGQVRPAVRREPPGGVMLDKGESEAAFIGSLRTHYNRNGTAESFAPTFKAAPHKAYSRTTSTVAPGASLSGPERLQRQEQQLWDEREEELVEAQERRFAQLEDALEAREAKREAYLVHRLEASAADKIAEHRRRQETAAHQRVLAVQRAQHLPALKQAVAAARPVGGAAALQKLAARPVFPASPALAAAVGQAAANIASLSGISTLQAGLDASRAFSAGADSGRTSLPLLGAGRMGWQEKQRAAASVQVDSVYAHIQAAKAAGSSELLSPLDAARAATDVKPARRGRKPGAEEGEEEPDTEGDEEEEGFDDTLEAAYAARLRAARHSPQPSQPASARLGDSGRTSEAGFSGGAHGLGQQESSRRGSRASMGFRSSGQMVAEATLLAEPTVGMGAEPPEGASRRASLAPSAQGAAEEEEQDMAFSLVPAWAGRTNNADAAEAAAAVPYAISQYSPAAASGMSGSEAEEQSAGEQSAEEGADEQPAAGYDAQQVEQPADEQSAHQAEQAIGEHGEAEEEAEPSDVPAVQAPQRLHVEEPAGQIEQAAETAAEHVEEPAEEHSAPQAEQLAEELATVAPAVAEPELVLQHSAGQAEQPADPEEGQTVQQEQPAAGTELAGSAAAVAVAAQHEELAEELAGQEECHPAEGVEQAGSAAAVAAEPELVTASAEELANQPAAALELSQAEAEPVSVPAAVDGEAANSARQELEGADATAVPAEAEPAIAADTLTEASMPDAGAPAAAAAAEELAGPPAAAAVELSGAAGDSGSVDPEGAAAEVPASELLPAPISDADNEGALLAAALAEQPGAFAQAALAVQLSDPAVELAACVEGHAQQLVHDGLLRLASCSLAAAMRTESLEGAAIADAEHLCSPAAAGLHRKPSAVAAADSAEAVGLTQRAYASLLFGGTRCPDAAPGEQVTAAVCEKQMPAAASEADAA